MAIEESGKTGVVVGVVGLTTAASQTRHLRSHRRDYHSNQTLSPPSKAIPKLENLNELSKCPKHNQQTPHMHLDAAPSVHASFDTTCILTYIRVTTKSTRAERRRVHYDPARFISYEHVRSGLHHHQDFCSVLNAPQAEVDRCLRQIFGVG